MLVYLGLGLISLASFFFIFFDYGKTKNARIALVYALITIASFTLLVILTKLFAFKLLYVLAIFPFLFILLIYIKSTKSENADKILDERVERRQSDSDLLDN